MILTPEGYLGFVRADELLRHRPESLIAWFADGKSYTVVRATLSAPNQIRLEGTRPRFLFPPERKRPVGGGDLLKANMTVTAADLIPVVRTADYMEYAESNERMPGRRVPRSRTASDADAAVVADALHRKARP